MAFSLSPKYDVFLNYHRSDVMKTFISHVREKLKYHGITMFEDESIHGSESMDHVYIQAIKESRISIVVISKNYASSKSCLNELLEILECKKELDQIVIPVFYGLNPSELQKQTGAFGITLKRMSSGSTEDQRRKWSEALNYVANIPGYPSENWADDAAMIEKIVSNISNNISSTLHTTNSKDFERMSLTAILEEKQSLLHSDNEDEAMRRQQVLRDGYEPPSHKKGISKSKSRCFTAMAILVVMNLVTEIASVVSDQLSSISNFYFTKISLAMSILSVVFIIIDMSYKIREQKACFRCKWPIPWFYYPSPGYRRIFGSYTDTVLLFCVVGGLIVSTINYRFIETGQDGPIKSSIWPLFFAIGMVVSKFLEKPISSNMVDPDPYHSMV